MQKPILNLSEALIRHNSTAQSFERGQDYLSAVFNVIWRGDQVVAQVRGSQYEPYTVSIDLDRNGVTDAACDCPYDWGGWCKHIVATLLACLYEPQSIEAHPSIEDLLAGLDRDQLHSVLVGLAEEDASLIDRIEREVALARPGAARVSSQRATIDQASIRRRVYAILHSLDHMRRSEAYWHVARVVDQVRQMLARAHDWIEEGDTANALAFLEAVSDAYIADWEILDDSDGDPSGFFADLGDAWEEAALAADLPPAERERWVQKFDRWHEQLRDYELDGVFELAQAAIEEEDDEP
jgi:uncharacterized Zn finger protein